LTDRDLEARAHAAHVAFLRLAADRSGGVAETIDGALAFVCGHPFPFLNGLVVKDAEATDAVDLIDRAAELFAERGREAWSIVTRSTGEDEALERAAGDHGLTVVNPNYPEMIATEALEPPALDRAVDVREVAGADDVATYWRLCREAYATLSFPPDIFSAFARGGMLAPPAVGCLAWLDAEPVGAAMVFVLEGVGLVAWVAAAPAARGRGVGAAVTTWATNRGFEEGADFLSLQASPMGTSVYERIGYRHLFGYRVWRWISDQASDAGQISR
jgi:GNAT superfamily N-acetyltransferase